MKTPDKMGTVASFFTYWDGPEFRPSEWNELDIEIVPSVQNNPFSMNVIYGDGVDKHESHKYAREFNPHDEWHTYTMEWTPDYISWSVDGQEMRHVDLDDPAVEQMVKEQTLRMNFWTPTFPSWGHGLDASDMPWYVLYDFVEVHTYDEEANEFNLHWRDEFNTFDHERWHKATGGFDSNSSIFHPDNVSVKGGNLVIKMEPIEAPVHHEVAVEHHEMAVEHHETIAAPILHHPHDRHRLQKAPHFDREQVREHRQAAHADAKFWQISPEEEAAHERMSELMKEHGRHQDQQEDDIAFTEFSHHGHKHHKEHDQYLPEYEHHSHEHYASEYGGDYYHYDEDMYHPAEKIEVPDYHDRHHYYAEGSSDSDSDDSDKSGDSDADWRDYQAYLRERIPEAAPKKQPLISAGPPLPTPQKPTKLKPVQPKPTPSPSPAPTPKPLIRPVPTPPQRPTAVMHEIEHDAPYLHHFEGPPY